jgi:putative ABC transport system permease protein
MFKNYFTIAWRNLTRQKLYSSIKIGGFALGVAACLLISLYIRNEFSFDRNFKDASRVYRAVIHWSASDSRSIYTFAPMANTLKTDFPEVEESGRLMDSESFDAGHNQVRRADQAETNYEEGVVFADQGLINILGTPFIYGDSARALIEPNTIVITKRKADKYFPRENPIGKTLMFTINGKEKPFTVEGVMEDYPVNSHLQCDFLLTLKGVEFWPGEQTSWINTNYFTYFKLRPGTDTAQFKQKLIRLKDRYVVPGLKANGDLKLAEAFSPLRLDMQALTDIHLHSDGISDNVAMGRDNGDIRLVWLLAAIAAFILIIACINFVNLSTAKAANRAKEVGLRKTVGSGRATLIWQFLSESLLFSILSFGIGLLLARLLLPFFNTLSGQTLMIPWAAWWFAPLLIAGAFITGLLAGLYPALLLSSFMPIQVLKGSMSQGSKNATLRSVLVVFQFAASIALIVGTSIIYRQMRYILDKKIGFDKDQVLMIEGTNTMGNSVLAFKEALLRVPGVKSASISDYLPVDGTRRDDHMYTTENRRQSVSGQFWVVDNDYIRTMSMKLIAGRDFSVQMPTDSQGIIINQTFAKQMGLGSNPVGERVNDGGRNWTVLGVVQDFHYESLRDSVRPLGMVLGYSPSIISIKLNSRDMHSQLSAVTGVWQRFAPHQPIRYGFLDQRFARMYEDLEQTGEIFTSFAILAIIISCLGLLGLSAFIAQQRTREIGIRKVLGASVENVVVLLSRDFIKLVLIAMLIATPLSWYGMHSWLQNFAYHVDVEWWVFVVAGAMAVLIALFTVSFQSIRAALVNPVQSLKSE